MTATSPFYARRLEQEWLTRKQVRRYMAERGCPVSIRTLARWASNGNRGKGPPFKKTRERIVRYFRPHVDAWLEREVVEVS